MKKFLTLFTALLFFGSLMTVHAYTFTSGTTIYIDFRNVSGGADFPSANSASTQYKDNVGGTIQAVTFTSNVTWNNGSTFIKTATGSWANIGFSAPSTGQNCVVVSANGKSISWTTVTNDNYTVYFKNNPGWSNVYVHLYNANTTFGGNGVGGNGAAVNATMTKIDAGPYWKYEYSSVVKYTKVCFTKEAQNNYDNFWQNECSWSDGLDFDNDLVLWIPNTASSTTKNSCTYYNTGAWSVYPPVSAIVSFSNLPASIGVGQQLTFAATSENVNNPTYTYYVKKGTGSYGSAVTSYTFAETGTYTVKVEVRSNGAGDVLAYKEETITCNPVYTVYFKNTPGWSNVYVHLYPAGQTLADNGVGGQSAEINAAMTKIDDGPYWKCEYNSATKYTKVCFTKEYQDGYEYFWQNECSWSTGLNFDNDLVLWIPNTASSESKNSCTYYNTGNWSVYPPLVPGVAFDGVPMNVLYGQEVTFAATSENVNNPTYTFYVKKGTGAYGSAVASYTFNEAGSYTVKVEVRENGAGEALASAEQAITCTKYSLMQNNHTSADKGSEVAVFASTNGTTFTANWTCPSAGTYYFYATTNTASDAHTTCDYLNGGQTFANGTPVGVYLYNDANNCYNSSITLNAPRAGEYTFTLTLNASEPHSFKCDYPEALEAEVNLDALPEFAYVNDAFTLADYVASVNVVQPEYTFYVKKGDAAYGSAVASYTFAETGTYTVKAEVREQNVGGDALDDVEKVVTVHGAHTFTAGTRIYVDFTAMTEGAKNVNYPFGHVATSDPLDYDENGAGTFKTIRFSENVTWSTMSDFIKTAKAGWAGQKFTIPAEGQNKIIVAADGASYTWGTYTPATVQVKFFAPRDESSDWSHVYAHSWDAAGDITAWPGVEITDTKANLWYAYNVQVGANLLFHNGNGMQTANIENIQAAACYEPTAINYEPTPKLVTVTANAGCEIAYYIAGSAALIGGAADFDTNLPLDENNQIVFHDVDPGTYSFKINNGTWAWSIGGIDHMKAGDCASIAQEVGVGDLGFKIDTKQDVTVTYYPATQEICLGAVTVKAAATITAANMTIEAGEVKAIAYSTTNTDATGATFTILSGGDYISLNNGVITGIKAGEAAIRITVAETANYTEATKDITVTVTTPADPGLDPIAAIGGKFIINAKGDTAVFSRGNLQYQQSSGTWRCAPNQYDWKGIANLQMGNAEFEGWVDLFCWSIGAENNYGATSAYLTTDYYNKAFVDWGGLFPDDWSTLSIDQWYYLLYTRANANDSWGMAMIGDNLGMVLLPEGWTAPSGVTFVPGTIPTTNMWYDDDCLDPTHADEDHWRLNPDNLPANKFTLEQWAALEAAGAVFCPYGGRRSGGYGNHTNRQDQTISDEYAYSYYENYYGAYWTSTVAKPAEGKAYWLPMICGGCDANHENWGRGSHGWWENGRYGHSVRLAHIIPRQYTVTYDANGAEGTLPTDAAKYLDGASVTLASATGLHKDGYVFAGWKYKDVNYNAGDAYTIANVLANEEIVFVAQWEPATPTADYSRNVTVGNYGTICLPNGGNISGAKLYDLEYYDGANTLYLLEVNGNAMIAGRPYIFLPSVATIEVFYTDVANASAGSYNGLVGSYTQEEVTANAGNYILLNNQYWFVNSLAYVGANRAYIHMDDVPTEPAAPQAGAPRRRVSMNVNNEQVATGMDALNASDAPVKVLIDGQIFILRGENMYNVNGQIVK